MDVDLAAATGARSVVLVEGMSDKAALEVLAARRGIALDASGVVIIAMGGATSIGHFLAPLRTLSVQVAGLCDESEEGHFRRALARAGFGSLQSSSALAALGFYVCSADLEDELIRAVGTGAVEEVVEAEGELRRFRTFQKQPAKHGLDTARQLHRFMGTRSGRKTQYARALAAAVDLSHVPEPLDRVLRRVAPA